VPNDKKRKIPINYTSREFTSIKNDLVNYARRYYPDTFQDYNEASFGSLMLDTVAYVGDILSFYLDYSVNESFLDTANDYNNVLKLSKQLGYRKTGVPVSTGPIALYVIIPASTVADDVSFQPDYSYAPILKRGAIFSTVSGVPFTLMEDVSFSSTSAETVVAKTDPTTGNPLSYAIKAYGQIMSGEIFTETFVIGDYERFPRISLAGNSVVDVMSVFDSNGNRFYEVDYLSQDTVYIPVRNNNIDLSSQVQDTEPVFIMKQLSVPRRFITEHEDNKTFLQFGFGSEDNLNYEVVTDPSRYGINMHGRDYIQDASFDPTNLINTDKLGLAPSNTTLTVNYRQNGAPNVNVSAKTIKSVTNKSFDFNNIGNLNSSKVREVIASLEFENEEPIVGSTREDTTEEIKYKAYGMFSSQNRAVTQQDYMSLIYNMPAKFGSVKRAAILQDKNSFKRNLNIYVVCEDEYGNLTAANGAVKNNIKTWLSTNKMINDTIDILDAKIVNLGLQFSAITDTQFDAFEVLNSATIKLQDYFKNSTMNIGESIRYGDVLRVLKEVEGLLDVVQLNIIRRTGPSYSSGIFNIDQMTTADGRLVVAPSDVIFEVKFPEVDIIGTIA
jgi:hypothetical protein